LKFCQISKSLNDIHTTFFSAASSKKDTIFGAAQTKLGPSYFVRALEHSS
jgi:hypothetical protein